MDRRATINARIRARCVVTPAPPGLDPARGPCCIWQGPVSAKPKPKNAARGHSYPRMSLDGQTVAVHRVVYVNYHGYLPTAQTIDHVCRRRLCVALKHLEHVTHKSNQKRRRKAVLSGAETWKERVCAA